VTHKQKNKTRESISVSAVNPFFINSVFVRKMITNFSTEREREREREKEREREIMETS